MDILSFKSCLSAVIQFFCSHGALKSCLTVYKHIKHHNEAGHLKTLLTQQNNHKCTTGHAHTHQYILKDTNTVRAGKKLEEMLMPTDALRRGCTALKWSLSHTKANHRSLASPIKLFSTRCHAEIACLVNPVCCRQKCSSITQVCVVANALL